MKRKYLETSKIFLNKLLKEKGEKQVSIFNQHLTKTNGRRAEIFKINRL